MSQPNSQPDIADRQFLAINAPRVGTWTEIGEAEVTYTMFGKAKVRIIRKNDKARRTRLLLLAALAVIVLAVAIWQSWVTTQQPESVQESSQPPQAAGARVQEVTPAIQPESIAPPQAVVETQPVAAPAAGIGKPAISQKPSLQQPAAPVVDEQVAKPAPVRRPRAAVTQGEPAAAESGALKAPAEKPSMPKVTPPSQPAAPVVAAPPPVKTSERPSGSTATVAVPAPKEAASAVPPAAEKQPSTPVSTQSK